MTKGEAIKRIKDWNLGHAAIEVLSTFIPELQESEDEKIRKELIDFFKSREYNCSKRFIAWLEKQDEECKEINLVEILKHYPKETELFSPLYGKLWLAEVDEEHEIITCYKYPLDEGCVRAVLEQEDTVSFYSNGTTGLPDFSVSKDCMLFLYDKEKQGEQKSEEEVDNPHNYLYGEQKPANKVEPKFKVGNWVVYCNEDVDLITGIEEKGYRINEGGYIPFACEDNMRLWTIKDAKDGDVLTSQYDKPFIYNGNRNSSHIGAYCGVTTEDSFYVATKKCYWSENTDVYPATQEQRDLLFSKMKEAGYEWDAEKKEMRKIEQKPVWNEEDDIEISVLINALGEFETYGGDFSKQKNWLKSLKDRMKK